MNIIKGKNYKIKGHSDYFKEKYGTSNPLITIEDTDFNVFGGSWTLQNGNPACMLFGMRSGFEGTPINETVYYGKIGGQGELVHEKELEEIKIMEDR